MEREFLVWQEANIELKAEVQPFQLFEDTQKTSKLRAGLHIKGKSREVPKP